jgi:hypothetical protein
VEENEPNLGIDVTGPGIEVKDEIRGETKQRKAYLGLHAHSCPTPSCYATDAELKSIACILLESKWISRSTIVHTGQNEN